MQVNAFRETKNHVRDVIKPVVLDGKWWQSFQKMSTNPGK